MNKQDILERIDNILKKKNFLDMVEEINTFNKEYKKTDFYKKNKIDLFTLIKYYKEMNLFSSANIVKTLQEVINNLDYEKIIELLNSLSSVFETENDDILNIIKTFNKN